MEPGDIIYWTPDDEGGVDRARDHCRRWAITPDMARIVRRWSDKRGEVMIMVEVKKRCKLKL